MFPAALVFSCDGKQTRTFQIGFEKCLQALCKYDLESVLQIKAVFGLKKQKMFSAALVLVVMENKHALSKLDLKNALQALFKFDLESDLQIKDAFGLKKKQKGFPLRLFWL